MNVYIYYSVIIPAVSSYRFLPEVDQHGYYVDQNFMHKRLANAEDIPFHVLIVYGSYFCSGSLIRSMIVVSAASCFARRLKTQRIVVKVGSNTIAEHGQAISVVELKIHEYFKRFSALNNDIALLALESSVTFGPKVKKAILIEPEIAIRHGTIIEVTGWAQSNLAPKYANHLLWTEMVTVDRTECSGYSNLITSSNYCAKYAPDRHLFDNGGPAMYHGMLVGVLSFGGNSQKYSYFAVFTNISYFHRWIALNSRRYLEKYCIHDEFGLSSEDESN